MTNLRILMLARFFPPNSAVAVHRIRRFVRHLPENGWSPVVVTHGTDGSDADAWLPDGAIVKRCHRWISKERTSASGTSQDVVTSNEANTVQATETSQSKWMLYVRHLRDALARTPDKEIWWALAAAFAGRRLARTCRADAIYSTGPPHSTHLAGYLIRRLTRLPWVVDFRDPWARRPWGRKPINPWGQHLDPWLERICVRSADRVILNTELMAEEFRRHYAQLDPAKFVAIPNGWDDETAAAIEQVRQERDQPVQRSDGTLRICHPGSLYGKRDPRPLVDAIANLSKEGHDISFEQIGNCSPAFDLPSIARRHGVSDRVQVHAPVPHDDILRRMTECDVLLLLQPGTKTQVPGKLFEMLLTGKPILALTEEGATADLVQGYSLGAVARSDDPAAIAEAIRQCAQLAGSSDKSRRTAALEDFDGRTLTGRLAGVFDELRKDVRPHTEQSSECGVQVATVESVR